MILITILIILDLQKQALFKEFPYKSISKLPFFLW